MKAIWIVVGVLGAIALVTVGVLGSAVGTYNDFVEQSVAIDAQGKQVDVAYQLAVRVVPQLTQLSSQYLANESEVQTRVAALRTGAPAAQNGTLAAKDAYAQQVLETRAFIVDVVNERYPDLKGVTLYRDTMAEIVNVEHKIAAEKVRYNDRVEKYNAHRRTCCLPLLVSGMFGFDEREFIGYKDRPNQSNFGSTL